MILLNIFQKLLSKFVEKIFERFDFIRKNLETAEIRSYLDIGSQIGYFVFKMNEWKGAYSIGMEKA